MKNILLPTDFSDFSAAAVEHASTFAVMYNARLHVLHVVKDPPSIMPRPSVAGKVPVAQFAPVEDELNKFVQRWFPGRRGTIQAIKFGLPHKEIVKYAEDEEVDLIVIATHGRTGLPHLVMGSVAEKVVRFSTTPVLTVKPPTLIGLMTQSGEGREQISELRG